MVEILPDVYLELPDSEWPPASAVTPAGTGQVTSWSYDRELIGRTLPGQVRARSGLSIGDGRAEIVQPSSGKPMAPWAVGDRRIAVGGRADLYATDEGPGSDDRRFLGAWQVDPAQGSLLGGSATVQLIEAQYAGRTQPNLLPLYTAGPCEPAWVVAVLARQAGFHNVPPPVASCILAASLSGSLLPEVGGLSVTLPPSAAGWDRSTGPIGPVDLAPDALIGTNGAVMPAGTASWFVTLNVAGTVRLEFSGSTQAPAIELRPGGVLAVRNKLDAAWQTTTYTAGESDDWPNRVQVELQRTGSSGAWSSVRGRARSGPDAAWSSWATSSASSEQPLSSMKGVEINASTGSSLSALQITTSADPALWAAPTADIDPLGGTMIAPWLPGKMDAWTGAQEVCAAFCAASWVTNDRIWMTRGREYLAGAVATSGVVDVDTMVEDLNWSIDPDDVADRLVVTYNPVDVVNIDYTAPFAPVLWSSPDVVVVDPGQTVDVVADVETHGEGLQPWLPVWTSLPLFPPSSWSAFDNREGTGTHVADDALTVTHRQVSAGRTIITVRNNTSSTLYLVDANGAPCLILRSVKVSKQENQVVITKGLAEVDSINEVTVDLGRYVQTAADAQAIADYVWARVSTPSWKVSRTRVRLDWGHDIGQVVELAHPGSDLAVKALIAGAHMEGSDGSIEQFLDLVMLPPTWFDFDQAWAGRTWAAFDALWAGKTWPDFDADPTKTT